MHDVKHFGFMNPFDTPSSETLLEMDTRDFVLNRALERLRDIVAEGRYDLKPHATTHARAEGFFEKDIVHVLHSGKVRAVYPQDQRWLICGYFEVGPVRLPLHVVVDIFERDFWVDVVTAFIPKHPHILVSRGRLALMLRFDQTEVKSKVVSRGERGRKRWKK